MACFGLIALMETLSIAIGVGAIVLSFGWFLYYDRGKQVSAPAPTHIAPEIRRPHLLLPVRLEREGDEELPSFDLLDNFSRLQLFVLGYRVIPEQTSPQQARENDDGRSRQRLREAIDSLPVVDGEIDDDLAYTSDPADLLARYAAQQHCQGILIHSGIERVDRLVLPLSRPADFGVRLVTVLRELAETRSRPLLLLLLEAEDESHWQDGFEDKARALVARAGIDRARIEVEHAGTDRLVDAVDAALRDTDLIILRESEGIDRHDLLATLRKEIDAPALVVLEMPESPEEE